MGLLVKGEFKSLDEKLYKIEIDSDFYLGSVQIVDDNFGVNPITVNWKDTSEPIRGSEASISILSSVLNPIINEFLKIEVPNTVVSLFLHNGLTYDKIWKGYVTPYNYDYKYGDNVPINFTAVDKFGILKDQKLTIVDGLYSIQEIIDHVVDTLDGIATDYSSITNTFNVNNEQQNLLQIKINIVANTFKDNYELLTEALRVINGKIYQFETKAVVYRDKEISLLQLKNQIGKLQKGAGETLSPSMRELPITLSSVDNVSSLLDNIVQPSLTPAGDVVVSKGWSISPFGSTLGDSGLYANIVPELGIFCEQIDANSMPLVTVPHELFGRNSSLTYNSTPWVKPVLYYQGFLSFEKEITISEDGTHLNILETSEPDNYEALEFSAIGSAFTQPVQTDSIYSLLDSAGQPLGAGVVPPANATISALLDRKYGLYIYGIYEAYMCLQVEFEDASGNKFTYSSYIEPEHTESDGTIIPETEIFQWVSKIDQVGNYADVIQDMTSHTVPLPRLRFLNLGLSSGTAYTSVSQLFESRVPLKASGTYRFRLFPMVTSIIDDELSTDFQSFFINQWETAGEFYSDDLNSSNEWTSTNPETDGAYVRHMFSTDQGPAIAITSYVLGIGSGSVSTTSKKLKGVNIDKTSGDIGEEYKVRFSSYPGLSYGATVLGVDSLGISGSVSMPSGNSLLHDMVEEVMLPKVLNSRVFKSTLLDGTIIHKPKLDLMYDYDSEIWVARSFTRNYRYAQSTVLLEKYSVGSTDTIEIQSDDYVDPNGVSSGGSTSTSTTIVNNITNGGGPHTHPVGEITDITTFYYDKVESDFRFLQAQSTDQWYLRKDQDDTFTGALTIQGVDVASVLTSTSWKQGTKTIFYLDWESGLYWYGGGNLSIGVATGDATFSNNVYALNLTGVNTGDQDLSNLADLDSNGFVLASQLGNATLQLVTDWGNVTSNNITTQGIQSSGDRASGSLIVKIGDYDWSNAGTHIEINCSSDEIIASTTFLASGLGIKYNTNTGTFNPTYGLTASRLWAMRDMDGTVAFLSDITGSISAYQLLSEKDQPSGYAGLDVSGKINPSQLPSMAITDTFVVTSELEMLALVAQTGDVAVRNDESKSYILQGTDPSLLTDWQELLSPTDSVQSVFGRTGVVTAQTNDYTWAQIDKTISSLTDITTRNFSDLQNTPTTISGYGISDNIAYTDVNNYFSTSQTFNGSLIINGSYVPLSITNTTGYAMARVNGFEIGGLTTATNEGLIKTQDNSRKLILDPSGWNFVENNSTIMSLTNTGVLDTSGSYKISGSDINTAGTLTNVAYLNQANVFTQHQKIYRGGPNLTFQTTGDSLGQGLLFLNSAGNVKGRLYNYADTGKISFWPGGSVERVVMLATGEVGIAMGTDSPTSLLTIGGIGEAGSLSVSGTGVGNIASFRDVDGENIFRTAGSLAGGDMITTFGDYDDAYSYPSFFISTSNTQFLNTNVGIGKVPTEALDVVGNVSISNKLYVNEDISIKENFHIGFLGPTDNVWAIGVNSSGINNTWTMEISAYDGAERYISLGGRGIDTVFNPKFVLNVNTGNVGIGTTSPGYLLDVNGSAQFSSIWVNGGTADLNFTSGGGVNYIESFSSDRTTSADLRLTGRYGQNMNKLYVEADTTTFDGNVGIGLTNPTYSFEVVTSTGVNIAGTNPSIYFLGSTQNTGGSISGDGNNLNLRVGGIGYYTRFVDSTNTLQYLDIIESDASTWKLSATKSTGTKGDLDLNGVAKITSKDHLDVYGKGSLIVSRLSTVERDTLTPQNGMVIYNITTTKFEHYENGAWVQYLSGGSTSVVLQKDITDETSNLVSGLKKYSFRMPYAMTLTGVRISLTGAPTGSTLVTVDINKGLTSILSTKLTIDSGEKTSVTATTPVVISDTSLLDDEELTIDIDSVGEIVAGKGLKLTLIGTV